MLNLRIEDRGAILIYFALLLVPLILFVALAVDTTRLASSHSQQRNVAGFASLTALETYVESASTNHVDRYREAKEKAELTIRHQLNTLLANKIENGGATVGELRDGTGTLGAPSDPNQVIGTIWGGNWWFTEPTDASGNPNCGDWYTNNTPVMDSSCPCPLVGTTPTWGGTCFEKNDSTATSAGAFRVSLNTSEESPVKTVFARVGGFADVKVSSTSQAAQVPRRGVFLVDLSRSMTFETHTPYPPTTLRPTEYAFRVRSGIGGGSPCFGPNIYTNECITPNRSGGTPSWSNLCRMTSILSDRMWNRANSLGGETLSLVRDGVNLFGVTKHYKDDYQCIMVDVDDDGTLDDSYLIDTDAMLPGSPSVVTRPHALASGGFYQGPQPLTTVLSSIRAALETIEERAISGDEIGVIFFDEDILEVRTFPPDGGLTAPGQADFTKLLEITNVDTSDSDFATDLATRLKALIFPRTLTDAGGQGRAANTSFPEALITALDMITESDISGSADNFIAIFSDGLTNCSHAAPSGGGASGEFEPDPYSDHSNFLDYTAGVASLPNGVDFRCENQFTNSINKFNNHLVSIQESTAIIAGIPDSGPTYTLPTGFRSYKDRGIAVHFFLVGDKVQPNTAVRPNVAGDACLEAEEAATGGYSFTYGGPNPPNTDPNAAGIFDPSTAAGAAAQNYAGGVYEDANNPYYHPNMEFYGKFTIPTAGIWAPIRPACDPSNWPTAITKACKDGGLVEKINERCADAVAGYSGTLDNPDIPVADVPGIIVNGALICDPYCRDPADSSADNVSEIYNRNPYILVENSN